MSDFLCLTPLKSMLIKPYISIHIVSKQIPLPNSLTSQYLLLTYLLMNSLDFSFWGSHMFWDNLNRLLGLDLHRNQWARQEEFVMEFELIFSPSILYQIFSVSLHWILFQSNPTCVFKLSQNIIPLPNSLTSHYLLLTYLLMKSLDFSGVLGGSHVLGQSE